MLLWWNGEVFQWQAKEKNSYNVTSAWDGYPIVQDIVYDNYSLGWIAAEMPITGKMTTKVIGNIYDNPDLLPAERN